MSNNNIPKDLANMIGETVEIKTAEGKTLKYVVGDISGDGKIDEEDLKILQLLTQNNETSKAILASLTTEQLAACDITGDGYINREDLLELCKKLVDKNQVVANKEKLSNLRNKFKK